MQWAYIYDIWTIGNITQTVTMGLNPAQSYLIEGFLTKKDGGDYAHVYIAEVCTQVSSDQINCGLNDEGSSGIVTVLSNATSVTVGLRTTGGSHRVDGVVWQL